MAVERPTFHESWYRVASLHPRLRTTVQISRQHFRGQQWHVVQDHSNNAFFRLAEPAYRFIGLLDGKRSVADAWAMVNEQLGDEAPTQGEVIQLLGHLYTANLLQAEVPADAHTLFARYRKRRSREVSGYLMNIMFARVPILDPDAFLEKWLPLLAWIFAPAGAIVWGILIFFAVHSIANVSEWPSKLVDGAAGVLSPDNLVLLYVAFALIKACHEMGHAISCKKFGRQQGTGGEVHVIGLMLLVFTPVPYVDASSSSALRNKWHRAIIGAAGMWIELGIASLAAIVWASAKDHSGIQAFSYNVMFVASVSTLLFNGNPLLRYDGYYILSDLLEIPNLGQRANEYVYYLVKRYVWNVRFLRNPAYSLSEAFWLFVYAIASFLMRALVSFSIMFYLAKVLNGALIVVAAVMGVMAVVMWVFMPLGKFLYYISTNTELGRVRTRAVVTSGLFLAIAVAIVGIVPLPDHARSDGVVEPRDMRKLYAGNDGFISGIPVLADMNAAMAVPKDSLAIARVTKDTPLLQMANPELSAQREALVAEQRHQTVRRNMAMQEDIGKAQLIQEQVNAVDQELANLDERMAGLKLNSPQDGLFVTQELEHNQYAFLHRGDAVGMVADLQHLIVRAAASNELGGPLEREASRHVEIRIQGQPSMLLSGIVASRVASGTDRLPSASLGYQVGGQFTTAQDDRQGTKTMENFFEVRINQLVLLNGPKEMMDEYRKTGHVPLFPGQRVTVRFDFAPKPIAAQLWTSLLQLFQKKFQV